MRGGTKVNDEEETREQLVNELPALRQRVAKLQAAEAERVRAEEEIRGLAEFPSENPNPVLRVAQDGTVTYANKAGSSLLSTWGIQVGQPLPVGQRKVVLDVLSSGSSETIEVEVEDRVLSLTFAPVADAGYVNVYGLDITERVRAEERIGFLAQVLNTSPLSVIATDANANIVYVNPATERLFGYKSDELLGRDPIILNAEPNAEEVQQDMLDKIEEGEVWTGELLNRRKNGDVFPLVAPHLIVERT